MFLGPIGVFGMGNAREQKTDARELYLLVEGPGWAYTKRTKPDAGSSVRQFASMVNVIAAEQLEAAPTASLPPGPTPSEPAPSDLAFRLRELGALRDEGI